MTDSNDNPPPRRRFLFNWKNGRRLLICAATLVTFAALLYTFENWRGRRAWHAFVADMKGRGEPLTADEILPPPVPDAENFAAIPLLKPLLDYRREPIPSGFKNVWRDQESYDRLIHPHFIRTMPKEGWADREHQRVTDFAAWQSAFRNDTNYHLPINQLSLPIVVTNDAASGMTEIRYDTNQATREILLFLATFDQDMNALHDAVELPHIQFPVHYEEGFAALLPHWQLFRHFGRVACLKASALLARDRPAAALRELRLVVRMSEGADAEPLLISQLVRIALINITMNVVWEGMTSSRWSDTELREMELLVRDLDLARQYVFSMRGERTLALHGLDLMRTEPDVLGLGDDGTTARLFTYGPAGWYQQNRASFGRMFDEYVFPFVDVEKRRFHLQEGKTKAKELSTRFGRFDLYEILSRLVFPAYEKVLNRMAHAQVSVDQLRIACAIERFRLARKRLPDELGDVAPFLGTPLPEDPTNGEAYRYRAENQSRTYRIWSPGPDGIDDGGKIEWRADNPKIRDHDKGDWVWEG